MALSLLQQASSGLSNFWSHDPPSHLINTNTGTQNYLTFDQPIPRSCPNAQTSCQNTSIVPDLCCFNAPGGQLLLTQFWDTHPPTGPEKAWTIHGLWPDKCDGSFEQFCDSKRHYSNISSILSAAGQDDLLSDMYEFWKDFKGRDPTLWSHEWNKHGTCISTLSPTCYDHYSPQVEVVDFFRAAVDLYKTLPTYDVLAAAGLEPDAERRFELSDIERVLEIAHGFPVTLRCRYGQLDEVWYHFDVKGSIQTGTFVPTKPDGPKGNCPSTVRYMPKSKRPSPTPPGGPGHGPRPDPPSRESPFNGRGLLKVITGGREKGCLISSGQWYSSGTCATFRATSTRDGKSGDKVHLQSRKGHCGIVKGGAIKCAANIRSSESTALTTTTETDSGRDMEFGYLIAKDGDARLTFGAVDDGGVHRDGNRTFFADKVPKGFAKRDVFVQGSGHATELEIVWQPI